MIAMRKLSTQGLEVSRHGLLLAVVLAFVPACGGGVAKDQSLPNATQVSSRNALPATVAEAEAPIGARGVASSESERPTTVTTTNEHVEDSKREILTAYRAMYRAMLDKRTDALATLLDDQYSLTHITGLRQPKKDWLAAIDSGQMRYHAAEEKSVTVDVDGDRAVLVGRSVVDATIYGGRGTWNLQLTTDYARKDGRWIAMGTVATTF